MSDKHALKCPKCGSDDVKIIDYMRSKLILCKKCSYDETKEYEIYPEEKASQKAKARYRVYKTGGKGRTKKRQH